MQATADEKGINMTTPLDPHRTQWRLRTCEIGTANIAVSLLFGTASLVCLGLGLVMPWWAAGAVAGTGLLLAALWADRHDSGESWSLTNALDRMEAFEEEPSARRADVPSSRDDLPALGSGHVRRGPARRRERSRGDVRGVPARVSRPARQAHSLEAGRPA